jgi:general stress protein 26
VSKEIELAGKMWKMLEHDRTVMLGLTDIEEGESQPMTAQIDPDGARETLYFFTARNTDLVKAMGTRHRALVHFASKGHDLFAALHGELSLDNDRAKIDRLWNRFVAAWFEGGKTDPALQLLRFEPERAHIWLNEHSLFAGVKMLLGVDPKRDYQKKVANVQLDKTRAD